VSIHEDLNEIIYGDGRPVDMPYNTTDVGNGQRLVSRHGEDLRYVGAWGRWMEYDGTRWAIDDTGEVERRAKETARAIYGEAERASSSELRKELGRHAMKTEAMNRIDAMIKAARSEPSIPVRPDDLDADPWLLNAQNGTVDLRTGELREHRREDLISKLTPVDYDPNAKAPTWEAFLERVLQSEGLRTFVQRAVGYSLTGDSRERVLLILHGMGRNGKSTFLEAIREALGAAEGYAMKTPAETLMAKPAGSIPNDIARLKGARFVCASETEAGRRLAEALVKEITGNDTISARFMKAEWFDFKPTHKVWLATNHKPEIRGTDPAIWDRIRLIPFNVRITDDEKDTELPEKLKAELPGILAWAVRGCLDWQRHGLGEPEEVKEATADYRAEMDVLAAFIEDRCVVHPDATVTSKALYAAYAEWCDENGERAEKQRSLGSRLTERGFKRGRGTGNAHIRLGIALRSDLTPDPDTSGGSDPSPDPGSGSDPTYQKGHAEKHPQISEKRFEDRTQSDPSDPKSGMNGSKNPSQAVNGEKGSLGSLGSLDNVGFAGEPPRRARRRLTEEEALQVQKLIAEGVAAEVARAEVIGGGEPLYYHE